MENCPLCGLEMKRRNVFKPKQSKRYRSPRYVLECTCGYTTTEETPHEKRTRNGDI